MRSLFFLFAFASGIFSTIIPLQAASKEDFDNIDLLLTPRFSSSPDMRINGFAGAGCALMQGPAAVSSNPAIIHAYGCVNKISHFLVEASYGKDAVFDDRIIAAGLSCLLGEQEGTVALSYRYLLSEEERFQHEATLNYSTRLFANSLDHGAVDCGINIRYERCRWRVYSVDSFPIVTRFWNGLVPVDRADTAWCRFDSTGMNSEQRVLLDIGFYQAYLAERLDFGLTFSNLFGYVWSRRRPFLQTSVDSVEGDTLVFRDSAYFVDKYQSSQGWIGAPHRCLSVGVAFKTPILNEQARIIIPADISFVGLNFFERSAHMRLIFRTGCEASFLTHYALRFGYARAPRWITAQNMRSTKEPFYANIFTFGGGINVTPFSADAYFGSHEFGLQVRITL